jgi:hypothetical protein
MSAHAIAILAAIEVRLRLRRLSTLAAVLAVMAVSWAMVVDPAGGTALIVVHGARVLYTSSALALGSASMAGVLFGLAGFYLVRGRAGEDLRSGIGGVIGATPVANAIFLAGRWLGAVAYLGLLVLAFMATMLALHALRGDGPIQVAVYLQAYALLLGPMILFAASSALLFDSWAPLMGKGGDILYFFLWAFQLSLGPQSMQAGAPGILALFDFTGMAHAIAALAQHVDTAGLAIGSFEFDPNKAPRMLPQWLFSPDAILERSLACVLATLPALPALPAALLFHRFSPDRVKAGRARTRRSPLALLNGWLRPLARLVGPLFALSARLPGTAGQALADLALMLAAAPAGIAALCIALGASLIAPGEVLPGILAGCVAFWGVFVSDTTTRAHSAGCNELGAVAPGGPGRRFLRHWLAATVLGWAFMGVIALRWLTEDPVRSAAVVVGVAALAAFACLLGRLARTPRLFLGVFLFGLYVALNVRHLPLLDVVGFNGAATGESVVTVLVAGLSALVAGWVWSRRS